MKLALRLLMVSIFFSGSLSGNGVPVAFAATEGEEHSSVHENAVVQFCPPESAGCYDTIVFSNQLYILDNGHTEALEALRVDTFLSQNTKSLPGTVNGYTSIETDPLKIPVKVFHLLEKDTKFTYRNPSLFNR